MSSKKNLFLFTAEFPFGKSEAFIENEINYLATSFENVYIIPAIKSEVLRATPENCLIVDMDYSDDGYTKASVLMKYPFILLNLYLTELKSNNTHIRDKKKLLSECFRMVFKAIKLEHALCDYNLEDAIFYSYWMDGWATLLSILRAGNRIPDFLTRAHRFDLYEDRRSENYIPFRSFQMEHADIISIISQHGVDYLKGKYPVFANKISLDYLGTNDNGLNREKTSDQIRIVSLSNLVLVKRVTLIVALLHCIDLPVEWTHIGDGILMDDLKLKIGKLPARHKVELKGRMSNQEVLNFMKTNPITFLINVSSSEGLPVSIMEAISFGIPVLATDVGGTNEIVNKSTGVLINKDFNVEELAQKIQDVYVEKFSNAEFRTGVRDFWIRNFSAKPNYAKFVEKLITI